MNRRTLAWAALAIVIVATLAIGGHTSGPQSAAQKAASISSEVRCPTCAGQSAELSDAPAAGAVRQFVLQQVVAGQSRGTIEQELKDRYGADILLLPPASGLAGLIWVLPVAVAVAALGGLALAFRRWRTVGDAPVTDADRERVAAALVESEGGRSGRDDSS